MFGPTLYRVPPAYPALYYQTFAVKVPRQHQRVASCAEVDCPARQHGWSTTIDEGTDLGQKQAHYIRRQSRRRFTEDRNDAGLTVFQFAPGQTCFNEHQVQDGPEIYLVREGDWRGGRLLRQHTRPEDWVEHFAGHQDKINTLRKKG